MKNVIHFVGLTFLLLASAGMGANDPNSPYQETLHKAEAGDPQAQYNLGVMYDIGQGVPQDYTEAAKWYTKAAEQGHADAQLKLGVMYAKGRGVPQDYAEAAKWFTSVAEQECELRLPELEVSYGDEEIIEYYAYAVEHGHAGVQTWVDMVHIMHLDDIGVSEDLQEKEAIRRLTKAAERGELLAQTLLGMFSLDEEDPENYEKWVKWLILAAEQGFAIAQHFLGEIYHMAAQDPPDNTDFSKTSSVFGGEGALMLHEMIVKKRLRARRLVEILTTYSEDDKVTQGYNEAFKWFTRAAEQGWVDSYDRLGEMFARGQGVPQNDAESLKWYKKAAEHGDVKRQAILGMWYYSGHEKFPHVPQNYEEAFKWMSKLAEQGMDWYQYFLALMYYNGEGVHQDYEKAAHWLIKAAEQNHAPAQSKLGSMYAKGEGVPQDDQKAIMWWTKAAEPEWGSGDGDAQYNLGMRYFLGQGVPQDYEEAVRLLTKAAEQNHIDASSHLAYMYAHGDGVPKDDKQASKWFVKLSEAQLWMGERYYHGIGLTQDYKEALKWYTKAANIGSVEAQFALGVMYDNGQGVPQDDREAVRWYTRAAQQGDAAAQNNLGVMYYNGQGVPEDYVQAYKWLNLAAAQGNEMAIEIRDKLRIIMTSAQIAEAQRLSREFVPRKEQAGKSETVFQREATIKGFGTGFFISDDGLFVTAAHVVQGASEVKVLAQNREYNAKTLFADSSLDIAVLHVEGVRGVGSLSVVPSGPVRMGDAVFTLGFPQVQLQGAEAKFTDGSISSLSGIGGDPKFFQISVPVQPGNSGGPLLDASGNVVGIVVSRLDAIGTLLATGSLPQNVNYALKSSFVLPLLESLPGVSERLQKPVKLDRPAAIEKTKNAVGLVVCVE